MRIAWLANLVCLICINAASSVPNPTSLTSTDTQQRNTINVVNRPIEGLKVKDLVDSKINGFLKRFGAVAPNNMTYISRSPLEPNRDQDNISSQNSAEKPSMVNVNFLLMGIGYGTYPHGRSTPSGPASNGQNLGNYGLYSSPRREYESAEWNIPPPSPISPIPGDLMQSRGMPWPSPPLPYYGTRSPYAGPFFGNEFGYGGGFPLSYARFPGLYGPGPGWPLL